MFYYLKKHVFWSSAMVTSFSTSCISAVLQSHTQISTDCLWGKTSGTLSLGHDLASRRCFAMDCRRNRSCPFGLSSSILKWKPLWLFALGECKNLIIIFFFPQNYGRKLILPLRHWKINIYCKILISIVIAWTTVKRYVNLYLNSPINCHINRETSEKSSCVILEKNCSK